MQPFLPSSVFNKKSKLQNVSVFRKVIQMTGSLIYLFTFFFQLGNGGQRVFYLYNSRDYEQT